MTATTVPLQRHGRCRPDAHFGIWFMSEDRPRRQRRGRGPRSHRPGSPGFGAGFGPGFGPGRRAGRGDIRAAILALLAEEPMHGYQMIQVISERSGGAWTPSPGSVYPTLQQLEDESLIEPSESETGRRVFALTEAGRAAASESAPAPWEEAGESVDDDMVELRDLVQQVVAATRQVAQAGTTAQVKAAQDVLRSARKALYRLLAED